MKMTEFGTFLERGIWLFLNGIAVILTFLTTAAVILFISGVSFTDSSQGKTIPTSQPATIEWQWLD